MARPVIVEAEEKVACPKCSHRFPLSEGISRQAIERHAEEFDRALAERRRKLEAQLAAEAKAQFDTQVKAMNDALAVKEAALSKFRTEELTLRRHLRELEEAKRNIDVDYQRKLEQGSQQLQGEAFELSLEALLKSAFPLDEILPVPKGVNGADLVQRVRSPSGLLCGTILWEAKQTKAWQPAWLRKLKDEQQAIGAEFAVIVTAAMPKETREPFLRDSDVWKARFDAARPLAELLRSTLVELHKQRQANLGRSEKME